MGQARYLRPTGFPFFILLNLYEVYKVNKESFIFINLLNFVGSEARQNKVRLLAAG